MSNTVIVESKNDTIFMQAMVEKLNCDIQVDPPGASHFCSQARNLSFEAGGRRQEERGRRKEPEELFLQI